MGGVRGSHPHEMNRRVAERPRREVPTYAQPLANISERVCQEPQLGSKAQGGLRFTPPQGSEDDVDRRRGRRHRLGHDFLLFRRRSQAEGFEPPTLGFVDRYSTIELRPYCRNTNFKFLSKQHTTQMQTITKDCYEYIS